MIVTKKHLPRRTFLRGLLGTSIALPLLDSMIPALTAGTKTAANPKTRMGFVYVPHGAVMDKWTPATEGAGFEFTPILKPLEPFRDRLLVVTGLANKAAESQGDGGGDHARSAPSYLSGIHPLRTEGEDVRAGTTIDQIAAQKISQDTPLPSLELGTEDTGLVGVCDVGYSCAYMNSISWRSPTQPLPMEINPRVVFERLFGDGSNAADRLARKREDSSILDSITGEVSHLETGLGTRDRGKISDYLDNIREIERRIPMAEKRASLNVNVPETPIGVPESFDEHAKLMYELQVLAYQAEITRVSTFMAARDLSQRTFPQIGVPEPHQAEIPRATRFMVPRDLSQRPSPQMGVPEPHHSVSHHGNNPAMIAKLEKI